MGLQNINSEDVRGLQVGGVRDLLGLVSQEPTLFDRTVAENIAYGDNTRQVSHEEVVEAAKQANIHTFIDSLPDVRKEQTIIFVSSVYIYICSLGDIKICLTISPFHLYRGMRHEWDRKGHSSPGARSNVWPSPAPSSGTPVSSCWTKPPQH